MKKQYGYSYASILVALIVINVISLIFISSIVVTNQATDKSNKNIIATRLAESCLEKNTHRLKSGLSIQTCELKPDNKYYNVYRVISPEPINANVNSSYFSPVITSADSSLKELSVTVEYIIADNSGEDKHSITLNRLVVTTP